MPDHRKSAELVTRANELMPGPHSNLRAPARISPVFIEAANGSRLTDVDGNEYIDYICGFGPGILGYGNRDYTEAVKQQLDGAYYLCTGELRTTAEIALAEKIVRHTPCADKVRFVLSGTETVQLAIRLARGYTNRPYFVRFDEHYHGWLDNVIGGRPADSLQHPPHPQLDPEDFFPVRGLDPGRHEQSFMLPWNDIGALEACLERYGEDIALVLMEPMLLNAGCCYPRPGYLERVRALCDRYGVVLCFDEVQTGFRVGLNSAQGMLGVIPDLCTFGKAFGGGIPFGAVAGKREIMDLLFEREVLAAGTFNGYPLGIAASLATLTILEKDGGAIYSQIAARQNNLTEGLREIATRRGVPLFIQGPLGVFFLATTEVTEKYDPRALFAQVDWKRQSRFEHGMIDGGILIIRGGRWFMSAAHSEADLEQTLTVADRVMGTL